MHTLIRKTSAISTIVIVYHSTQGHTVLQAEAVLHGVRSAPGTQAYLLTAYEATARLDELDHADAIILGCPTHQGSISTGMKDFIEAAAKKWHTHSWNKKIAGAFTNSSSFSGDKLNTLVGVVINAMQHGMIFVGLGIMPSSHKSDETNRLLEGSGPDFFNRAGPFIEPMADSFQLTPYAPSKGDLETAEAYGRRVAEITLQFVRGRIVLECPAGTSDELQTSFSFQSGK